MDDEAWDRLCSDAHAEDIEQGRDEGRKAGEKAGQDNGWDVGRTYAVDIGIRVGFIRGCRDAIDEFVQGESLLEVKRERILKSIRDLDEALEKFPNSGSLFQDPVDIERSVSEVEAKYKVLVTQLSLPKMTLERFMQQYAARNGIDETTSTPGSRLSDW